MTEQFLRGVCYAPFPQGYDPSTANQTCIFFGSDIASYNMKPLWGPGFSPVDGPDRNRNFKGRNDIATLAKIGVNLIRLYDWDPRNDHLPFLDYCHSFGIKVLVPVSNYNFGVYGSSPPFGIYGSPPPPMQESITNLLKSFCNQEGTDYHPAIYGIAFGNELDMFMFEEDPGSKGRGELIKSPKLMNYVAKYTKTWVDIEQSMIPSCRRIVLGHPISFAFYGLELPCVTFYDKIISPLRKFTKGELGNRLILCPNTFNHADYLYSKDGWVDYINNTINIPILFTEIGCSRLSRDDYNDYIARQLEGAWTCSQQPGNYGKLLGTCYFQYCDKVWCRDTSEGSFGMTRNTNETCLMIRYGEKDFSHTDGNNCKDQTLPISVLANNPVFNTVKLVYSGIEYSYRPEKKLAED